MCLAIYKPAGVKIDESALETGFENNNDGAGFTFRNSRGELRTYKGFFKFKDFIRYWRNFTDFEAMIHFRWATSGKTNKDNCHPFRFGRKKGWSMIHNGVLTSRHTDEMSDTACFAQDVLHELAIRDMLTDTDVIEQLETCIGRGNKMVLMPPTGNQIILNEDVGFWQDDAWWSNSSFEHTTYRYFGSSGGSSTFRNWWDEGDDEYEQWSQLSAHGGHTVPNSTPRCTPTGCEGSDTQKYLEYLEAKWRDGLNETDVPSTDTVEVPAITGTYQSAD